MPNQRKPLTGPDDPRHGTRGAYQHHGCRCDRCVAHEHAYQANYYRGVRTPKPASEFSVVKFKGWEIHPEGRRGVTRVDWHVCDSRGRTQRIFTGPNAQRDAKRHARTLNIELSRARIAA